MTTTGAIETELTEVRSPLGPQTADERICFKRAMDQWRASLKRPDLDEEGRVKGALDAYCRQAFALSALKHQESGEPETAQWRDLALQFDGQRIAALEMLRYAVRHIEEYATVRDILKELLQALKLLLAAPPLSGEAVLAERLAASPQPQAQPVEGVGVKPLEWESEPPYSVARMPRLLYSTEAVWEDGKFLHVELRGNCHGNFPSVGEAKAAAQQDYEARIRSALIPSPANGVRDGLTLTGAECSLLRQILSAYAKAKLNSDGQALFDKLCAVEAALSTKQEE